MTNRTEEFQVNGADLLKRVKEIVSKGNVRRIGIKNKQGKMLIEIPLTAGVIAVALLPGYAAIGVIAAMVAQCTIVVEREGE